MPGLVPGIHAEPKLLSSAAWMAGTSPAMTIKRPHKPSINLRPESCAGGQARLVHKYWVLLEKHWRSGFARPIFVFPGR
jgi:hypothetical protein